MSKNTGTSELINYFDLGVNGDVGIAGSLDINTIANATTDTDKFLVSDSGVIKYRTGAELLSDIGGQVSGNYVTLDTNQTITGEKLFSALTLQLAAAGSASPTIIRNTSGTTGSTTGYNTIGFNSSNNIFVDTTNRGGFILGFNNSVSNRTYTLQDASGTLAFTSQIPANPVGGTGTTNTLPKFTSSTTIGNSLFTDDGTNGAFGGANYSVGTNVRTFNISAPLYAGLGFWANNQYTGDIFSYGVTGNLFINADPQNIFSETKIVLAIDGTERLAVFNNGNVSIANNPTDSGFKFRVVGTSSAIATFSGDTNGYIDISDGTVNSRLQNTAQGFLVGTVNDYNLNFRTNNTIRATIDGTTGAATFSSSVSIGSGATSLLNFTGTSFGQITSPSTLYYDIDTQIFRSTSGSERMRITSGGNVLIGTTTDSGQKLQVNGAIKSIVSSGGSVITAESSATNGEGQFVVLGKNSSGTVRSGSFKYDNADLLRIGTSSSIDFRFETNDIERMRITSGGNVGIGTTAPENFNDLSFASPILDVAGSIQIKGIAANGVAALQFGGDTYRKGIIYTSIGTDTPYLGFGVATSGSSSSASEYMRITSGGNVGINTDNPNGRLAIKAEVSDTPSLVFKNEIGGPSTAISNYVSAAQTFTMFGTNVYVNSTANLSRFDASKQSCGILLDEGLFRVLTGPTNSNPSTRMSISSTGETTFSSSVTATAFFQSSDLRKKDIIKKENDVVYFTWKDGEDKREKVGYIAQEVQKYMPNAVNEDTNGMLSVDYIQVLVSKILVMEKEIENLKNRK